MFYIDKFRTNLMRIDGAEDAIERFQIAIASENRDIELLTEQQNKIHSEIIQMKDEFVNTFVELYKKSCRSVQTTCEYGSINVRLNFLEKDYKLFNSNQLFVSDVEEINSQIAGYIYEFINTKYLTFSEKVKELSDLYAKYEVNPEFIKKHILKVYNGIKINVLKNLINSRNANLQANQTSLVNINAQLSSEFIKPTLMNKIFKRKQLMLQEREQLLYAYQTEFKDEIRKYEQEIEEINENPEKNLVFVEYELKALSDFLDIYELIKQTQSRIFGKQSEIDQINEKINAKRSWINEYNKNIEEYNSIIKNANKTIEELCESLAKDNFTFHELCKISDDATAKKFLEYYEKHIESSIQQLL